MNVVHINLKKYKQYKQVCPTSMPPLRKEIVVSLPEVFMHGIDMGVLGQLWLYVGMCLLGMVLFN